MVSSFEFAFHEKIFPFSKYFDRLIAVSNFGLEIHARKPEFKDKLVHLYNFHNDLKTTLPNNNKGDYFLYFGRLSHEKGIHTLLKAWESIKPKLKIVGEGSEMRNLSKFITDKNLTNIELLGFKSGKELENLISNASFIIVPSEWYENNPLTIIESYANGKPVIASKIGGITEIVINNETGFLYEMGNIQSLIFEVQKASKISENDYLKMSKKSREFAEINFSQEKHYNDLMNIYKKLINEKKKIE